MTNNTGDTALHTVCSALVAGTLVAGVSAAARCHLISYKNGIGETALDTATRAGRSAVEKYLLGIQEKSAHKQITVVSCGGLVWSRMIQCRISQEKDCLCTGFSSVTMISHVNTRVIR